MIGLRLRPARGKRLSPEQKQELLAIALRDDKVSDPDVIGGVRRVTYATTGDSLVFITRDDEGDGRIFEHVRVCRIVEDSARYIGKKVRR